MHILLCCINQKKVLQKEIKDWAYEVYLLTGESSQFLIPTDFLSNREGVSIDFCSLLSCQDAVKYLWPAKSQ